MTANQTLLPSNATPWMRLQSEVNDPLRVLAGQYKNVRVAGSILPPQFIPWVIWQYGLGELTPYVPSLGQLINEGVRWQRVRGTPAAIYQGLAWIGYAGQIEEASARRRRWNRFQVRLSRVRDTDAPDLARIDGIVSLSPPARSRFARGFHGYDVRAAETGFSRTSAALTSFDSGVKLPGIAARWSFGRSYDRTHDLTQAELTALGTWIAPPPASDLWAAANYLWVGRNVNWAQAGAVGRRNSIANALITMGAPYIRFRNASGAVIGHARAVVHRVKLAVTGPYQVGASSYAVTPDQTEGLIVAARTGFGDGMGQVAASMSVLFGGVRAASVKPGARWIGPGGLTGGTEAAVTTTSIPFGATVRERPKYLLRF